MSDLKKEDVKEPPFTLLTVREKYVLCIVVAFAGLWSTLSSAIYFPIIPTIRHKFNVSDSMANLSVVVYLICQGIFPSFVSPFADAYGKKPVMVFCLGGYCIICACIGKSNVYWLVLVLRCLQAAFIAPIASVAIGCSGDFCFRKERGTFVSIISGFIVVAQAFGGLVGAAVASRFQWRGVFYFLAIGGGGTGIAVAFAFPETNRKIVGNLSIYPKSIINKSPLFYLYFRKRIEATAGRQSDAPLKLSPWAPYKVFFRYKIFCILMSCGLYFATWTISMTSLSTRLETNYNYTIVQTGLSYLSPGVGAFIGSLISGRILDWNYRRRFGDDKEHKVSIYMARLETTIIPSFLCCGSYIAFGWCLEKNVNVSAPLIFMFIFSFCCIFFMSAVSTLLVDLYPSDASSSASCLNLARCLLSALFVGVLSDMEDAMGIGGVYTLMSGLCILSTAALFVLILGKSEKNTQE